MMQVEVKKRKQLWEILWGPVTSSKIPKVDNERVEKLLKGGYLFGFTAIDLLIILSSILTIIFLQLKPYLIPYLEGSLGESKEIVEVKRFISDQKEKTSSPSSKQKTSTISANTTINEIESTSSSKPKNEKSEEQGVCKSH